MCLRVLVLSVFIVCYRIAKCIREITRGSVMCRYLTSNDLIYDRMNTLYNTTALLDCSKLLSWTTLVQDKLLQHRTTTAVQD